MDIPTPEAVVAYYSEHSIRPKRMHVYDARGGSDGHPCGCPVGIIALIEGVLRGDETNRDTAMVIAALQEQRGYDPAWLHGVHWGFDLPLLSPGHKNDPRGFAFGQRVAKLLGDRYPSPELVPA